MSIINFIVHEVHEGTDEPVFREEENVKDEKAEELSSQISKLFGETGLSIGGFTPPEENEGIEPILQRRLEEYFINMRFTDFLKFTVESTKSFKKELDLSKSGKGGFLLFNHYSHKKESFLSIILLRNKSGMIISETLTLDKIESLDLDKLHMAARINLSKWLSGNYDKYISFKIGRSANDVRDYFSNFIGCREFKKIAVDTNNLVKATDKWCKKNSFDDETTNSVKNAVNDYCLGRLASEKPAELDQLSDLLDARYDPEEKGLFLEVAQTDYELNNEIPLDRNALRGLIRYSGRTKDFSISFNSDLLNKTIHYDQKTGALKIDKIPIGLQNQLINK